MKSKTNSRKPNLKRKEKKKDFRFEKFFQDSRADDRERLLQFPLFVRDMR